MRQAKPLGVPRRDLAEHPAAQLFTEHFTMRSRCRHITADTPRQSSWGRVAVHRRDAHGSVCRNIHGFHPPRPPMLMPAHRVIITLALWPPAACRDVAVAVDGDGPPAPPHPRTPARSTRPSPFTLARATVIKSRPRLRLPARVRVGCGEDCRRSPAGGASSQ